MGTEQFGLRLRPAYDIKTSWAARPAANAVAIGTRWRSTDLLPETDWYSDGTWWRPVGGVVRLCAASPTGVTSTATTETAMVVPGGQLPVIPFDYLMKIPGGRITTQARFTRASAQSAQTSLFGVYWNSIIDGTKTFARTNFAVSTAPDALIASQAYYIDGVNYLSSTFVAAYPVSTNTAMTPGAIPAAPMVPVVACRTGGAGETATLAQLVMEFWA